ncbi:hypothetical protein JHK85_031728 [Glycine max]|nr:hypothetical protein JHK85_031728 [Glycine max]
MQSMISRAHAEVKELRQSIELLKAEGEKLEPSVLKYKIENHDTQMEEGGRRRHKRGQRSVTTARGKARDSTILLQCDSGHDGRYFNPPHKRGLRLGQGMLCSAPTAIGYIA